MAPISMKSYVRWNMGECVLQQIRAVLPQVQSIGHIGIIDRGWVEQRSLHLTSFDQLEHPRKDDTLQLETYETKSGMCCTIIGRVLPLLWSVSVKTKKISCSTLR